jgi:hypothetical protein
MEKIRLKRMNHPDLVFRGKLMASADKEQTTGAAPMRLRLFLYETDVARLILAVTVMSQPRFSDSKTFHGALAFDSLDTIRDFLASEDGRDLSETAGLLLRKTGRAPRTSMKETNRFHQRSCHV